jgi:N-acetyl-anhydromuramyl-L-alanine amidase AmpD
MGPTTRLGAATQSSRRLTPEQFEQVRGGGWPLELVQEKVDQFVYHYDVAGVSRNCFKTLHDDRDLSVHFMLDLDGTIYQTLDGKEAAWHATKANGRSVGIGITNMGAWEEENPRTVKVLASWYRTDENGHTRIVFPGGPKMQSSLRTKNFVARPARDEPVIAQVQNTMYRMYDLTPQQYDSLIKLTATLCTVFPKINCDAPREPKTNAVINHVLPPDQLKNYQGVMGHYHVQTEKQDPGPAFQWDRVIYGAQSLMTEEAKRANREALGHPALPVNTARFGSKSVLMAETWKRPERGAVQRYQSERPPGQPAIVGSLTSRLQCELVAVRCAL